MGALKCFDIFLELYEAIYTYVCVHEQERPERSLVSHLWLSLSLCTSRK